jgi:acyl carrier protein
LDNLYARLAEILEVEQLRGEDVLSAFDTWDSLTVLSILAMLDASYGVNLTAAEVRRMATVADLAAAVAERLEK